MSELKPCPFCGGASTWMNNDESEYTPHGFWVECCECEARGPENRFADKAVELWNKRHDDHEWMRSTLEQFPCEHQWILLFENPKWLRNVCETCGIISKPIMKPKDGEQGAEVMA